MHLFRTIFGGTTYIGVKTYREEYFGKSEAAHVLLDVRNPNEFSDGTIKGAINIPLNKLAKKLHTLPKDQKIICICRTGSRSREAVHLLQKAGYTDVINMMGGVMAWRNIGEPLTKPSTR